MTNGKDLGLYSYSSDAIREEFGLSVSLKHELQHLAGVCRICRERPCNGLLCNQGYVFTMQQGSGCIVEVLKWLWYIRRQFPSEQSHELFAWVFSCGIFISESSHNSRFEDQHRCASIEIFLQSDSWLSFLEQYQLSVIHTHQVCCITSATGSFLVDQRPASWYGHYNNLLHLTGMLIM